MCPKIQEHIEVGLKNGALGGKLVGAGGGGLLLSHQTKLNLGRQWIILDYKN